MANLYFSDRHQHRRLNFEREAILLSLNAELGVARYALRAQLSQIDLWLKREEVWRLRPLMVPAQVYNSCAARLGLVEDRDFIATVVNTYSCIEDLDRLVRRDNVITGQERYTSWCSARL